VLFDPQTAGGLLIALSPGEADKLVKKMHREGLEEAAIVGEIIDLPAGRIKVIL